MIIKWNVFADLHFENMNFNTNGLRNNLIEYLKTIDSQVDFILLAGDSFYKVNENTNTDPVVNYIKKIKESCLMKNCTNVYIVKGNHDIIRSDDKLSMLTEYTGINYDTKLREKEIKPIKKEQLGTLI